MDRLATPKNVYKVILGSIVAVPVFALITRFYQYEHLLLWIVSLGLIIALFFIIKGVDRREKRRLLVVLYYTALATIFMIIFEQAGSSLTLFADRNVDLIGITAAQTNSINAGFIMLLAIPFAALWTFLEKVKRNPHSSLKMGVGLILLGLGFVIFAYSSNAVNEVAKVPMFYLFLGYFVLTMGELFLSPIGLSKMTELSPKKFIAFVMGIWFLSSFYGHYFAGKIAAMTTVGNDEIAWSEGVSGRVVEFVTGLNPAEIKNSSEAMIQLYSYVSVFAVFGLISVFIGVLALFASPWIKDLSEGVN